MDAEIPAARATFEDLCADVEDLVRRYMRGGTAARVERSPGLCIARVYGPGVTPLDVARDGLEGISDLASDTAEHHPYWGAVSGCSAILETLLERWDGRLTLEDASQVRWDLERIGRALDPGE